MSGSRSAWERFIVTGSVADYLRYCSECRKTAEFRGEESDANRNAGNCRSDEVGRR